MPPEKIIDPRLKPDDMCEMFAWLDYCVAKGFGGKKFRQTVLGHLSRTRQKDVTWAQIDERIRKLWNYHAIRKPGQANHSSVYSVGTKALWWYFNCNGTAKELIRDRVKQMGSNKRRDSDIRGAICDSLTLGSVAPSTLGEAPEHSRWKESSTTPSTVSNSEYSESLGSPHTPSKNSVVEDLLTVDEGFTNINPKAFPTPAQMAIQRGGALPPARTPMLPAENNMLCDSTRCEAIRQLLVDREREAQYFRLEFSKAQDTIKGLRRELQCEKHTHTIFSKDRGTPIEETLKRYLNEIEILRSKVEDKEMLSPFTTQIGKKHIPFDEKYFQRNTNTIRYTIEEFMPYADTSRMCSNIKFKNQTGDLGLLFRRVVGEFEGKLRSVSFHSLLQSLLSAAVCEWVLECDFQEHFPVSTPWRDAMLSHLATQDGDDAARNLDFAAHHSLIESEYFQQNLISTRAKALAARISAAIAPLFRLKKPLELWDVDIMKKLDQRLPALIDMFKSALRIKTRALVSKDIFEVVLPLQGNHFDQGFMEDEELNSVCSPPGEAPLVRLCVVPGLRKYGFDRKLVDYNSFRKPGFESTGQSDVIAKAVVIIEQ
ncbi:hypothetical protein AOQ84DRAFT_361217 [Glonium stellatum]|uniref:Uncharacterized protein n=1 Tax=Glonium stellatum TaxID=574774 RepID=A0A8E2JW15_9PEZI|nr:hypothetical protein AOQ84DRAFT_361217 [Glonium stellatum]